MAKDIKIRKADGTWVIRSAGAVIGESRNALELSEGALAPVIYFPRDDVAMAFLDASDHSTHCPHKGDASYFHLVNKSGTLENAVWSYEAPLPSVAEIAGYLAFYPGDMITVEQL